MLILTSGDVKQKRGSKENAAFSQYLSQAGALELFDELNDGHTVLLKELREVKP